MAAPTSNGGLGFISHSPQGARQVRGDGRGAAVRGTGVRVPIRRHASAARCSRRAKPWECKCSAPRAPRDPIAPAWCLPRGACAAYYNYGRMNATGSRGTGEPVMSTGRLGRSALHEHESTNGSTGWKLTRRAAPAALADPEQQVLTGSTAPGGVAPVRRTHHDVARRRAQGDPDPDRAVSSTRSATPARALETRPSCHQRDRWR